MTTTWQRVFAALYDPFFWLSERAGLAARRRALIRQAAGRVLEIGAGTGLNARHYPDGVELVLSEPDEVMADRLRDRVATLGRPVTVVLAGAEALPFADGEFDTVVSTLVLCTVPDMDTALREIHRVLKPGGRLLFMEHVRSESPRWARWQDRLNRPWRAFAEGCNCNRATLDVLARSPLGVNDVEHGVMPAMVPLIRPLATGSATASRP
jgi:ubiquinone/menaquinone biosynthesis C-methylase UbiE